MPSPLAFLAGFGQGAAGLGQDMETQAALQEAQRARRATDALTRLATMVKLGAQPVMPGTDPTQALQALQNRNTQQAGLINAPGAGGFSGGMDPSQFGQPQIATLPTAAGGQDSFILDPSRTPEALAELRAGRAEDARYRQATDVENQRTAAARAEKDQERHTADVRTAATAFGDAQALQALVAKNPKSPYASLLKNLPDSGDTAHWISLAPSLDKAFKDESARQLQASEYHATPAMWTQTGDVDKVTGEPVFVNTASPTLERRTLTGAMPKPGSGGGSQSLSPEDRARMIKQAQLDNATMKAYEKHAMATGAVPGTTTGVIGAAAGNTEKGFFPQAGAIVGNRMLGAIDPEYQKYLTAQLSYSRIMGNLQSKRFTDHQQEIEKSIGGLRGNDLNGTIEYKQMLRDASLADYNPQPVAGPTVSAANDLEAYIANRGGKKKP